jgi:3-hydroxymyristoyl/3-hydroxydecanoyl-(acyl carrier protein) dehydratase
MTDLSLALSIAADHPAYAGHFPGRPILPGVVLLDAALHALAALRGLEAASGQIKSAKFLSPVSPGEALRLDYAASVAGVFRFEVVATAVTTEATHERVVASGVFVFTPPRQDAA